MDAVGEDGLAMLSHGLDHEHVLAVAEREGLKVWAGDCAFVEGPDRERAMLLAAREVRKCVVDAFATALHRAIKRGRVQTGRELAYVVEHVLDVLEEDGEGVFWRISEALSVNCRQAAYSWAGHAIREATDAFAARRMLEEERRREQEQLRREAEERERIRQEWAQFHGSWRDLVPQLAKAKPHQPNPQQPARARPIPVPPPSQRKPTLREDPQAVRSMLRKAFNWNRGGYWTLGSERTDSSPFQRRKRFSLSPGEARRLERELSARLRAAELAGDRELAGQIFAKLVELQRAAIRGA